METLPREVQPKQPSLKTRLLQIAQDGRNPHNRDLLIAGFKKPIRDKLDRTSSTYDRNYDLWEAQLDNILGEEHPALIGAGRQKLADTVVRTLRTAGFDLTDRTLPFESLTRACIESFLPQAPRPRARLAETPPPPAGGAPAAAEAEIPTEALTLLEQGRLRLLEQWEKEGPLYPHEKRELKELRAIAQTTPPPPTEPLEATTAADRTRASLDRIGERRRAEREQAVTELEERFRRGELQLRTPIIVDAVFENQMIYTETSRPLWTCDIATLRNGLKALHAYDETTDTEEHMVREVRGLFDTRGFLDNIALRHLLGNRSERGIDMQDVLFEQAIQRLAEGNGVLLHNSGGNHLVLYAGLQARMVDGENILGVRKVNPLRTPPQSEFVSLRDLLSDVDDYRIMYRSPPSQVRMPRRPTAETTPTAEPEEPPILPPPQPREPGARRRQT